MCGSTRTPPRTSLDRCGLECTLWLKCKASFPYSIDSSSRNVKQAFHFSPQCRMFSVSPLFLACCAIIRRSSSLLMVNSRPFTDRRRQSAIGNRDASLAPIREEPRRLWQGFITCFFNPLGYERLVRDITRASACGCESLCTASVLSLHLPCACPSWGAIGTSVAAERLRSAQLHRIRTR